MANFGPLARRGGRGGGRGARGNSKWANAKAAEFAKHLDHTGRIRLGNIEYSSEPWFRKSGPGGWHIWYGGDVTGGPRYGRTMDGLIWLGRQDDPEYVSMKNKHPNWVTWGGYYRSFGGLKNYGLGMPTFDLTATQAQAFTHTGRSATNELKRYGTKAKTIERNGGLEDAEYPDPWQNWQGDRQVRDHEGVIGDDEERVDFTKYINLEPMHFGSGSGGKTHDSGTYSRGFDVLQLEWDKAWFEYDLNCNNQVLILPIAVNDKWMGYPLKEGDSGYGYQKWKDPGGSDFTHPISRKIKEWGMTTHIDGQILQLGGVPGHSLVPEQSPLHANYQIGIHRVNRGGRSRRYDHYSWYWDLSYRCGAFEDAQPQWIVDAGLIWWDARYKLYRHWFDTDDNREYCKLHKYPYQAMRHKVADEVCDVSNLEVDDVSENVVLFEFIPNYNHSEAEKYIYVEAPIVVKEVDGYVGDTFVKNRKQACVVLYNTSLFWNESKHHCNVTDVPNFGKDYEPHRHIRWYAGQLDKQCSQQYKPGYGLKFSTNLTSKTPKYTEIEDTPSEKPKEYYIPVISKIGKFPVNNSTLEVDLTWSAGETLSDFRNNTQAGKIGVRDRGWSYDTNTLDGMCKGFLTYSATNLPLGLFIDQKHGYISGKLYRNLDPGLVTPKPKIKVHNGCPDVAPFEVTLNLYIASPDEFYWPSITSVNGVATNHTDNLVDSVPKTVTVPLPTGEHFSFFVVSKEIGGFNTDPQDPTSCSGSLTTTLDGNAPTGITINSASGEISGTINESGEFNIVIRVDNGCGGQGDSDEVNVKLVVEPRGEGEPVQPGEGEPGEPGEGEPGEPGDGEPGEPGEGEPGEPGDGEPGEGGNE